MCQQSHIPYYTAFYVSTIPHSILYSVWCVNNPTFHTIQRLMCQQSHIPYYTAFDVWRIPHSIIYSVWCVNSPTFHTIQRLMCHQSHIPYYTAFDVNSPTFHTIQRLMCQQSHIPYYTAFDVSTIPCQDYFRAPKAITANQEIAVQSCGTGMYRVTIITDNNRSFWSAYPADQSADQYKRNRTRIMLLLLLMVAFI